MSASNGHARAVFLAVPSYGGIEPTALPGLLLATEHARWTLQPYGGSLLAYTFNTLWCAALNSRPEQRWSHFAMHHNDIDAPPGWLDVLMDELDRTGADVLSVAVAIKDPRGLTSSGVMEAGGNIRRLTMREVHALPETFGLEDIAWAAPDSHLAVNTGLWVCRFDRPWVETFPGFNICDAIKRGDDGVYRPHVLPEDWNFSRWCARAGLKVRCTRKVVAGHHGKARYHNEAPWGDWSQDLGDSYRGHHASAVLPDVEGWLTDHEGRTLARLAEGKRVLEIGSYKGRSTIWMARTARGVTAVDTFDGRATGRPSTQGTYDEFKANLDRHGVLFKVAIYRNTSAEALADMDRLGHQFDLVFIDGDHSYEAVKADIAGVLPLLAQGGLLAFHDYGNHVDPGVDRAVNELLGAGATLLERADALAVVRPARKEALCG